MKSWSVLFFVLLLAGACRERPVAVEPGFITVCNPVNLSYRFQLDSPSRREAADPTVVAFRGMHFLFASKSGGYWCSDDLAGWNFIATDEIPVEEYAPTAIALGDTLYFLASSREKSTIYKSVDPLSGKWQVAREELDMPVWDPAFFVDDDRRLYLYWGCSDRDPLYGVELDRENNFSFIGTPVALIHANPAQYGWEVPGDYNTLRDTSPWIEGPWLNKRGGRYYLQYAGPGTEYKSYADAVYVGDQPLGPYTIARHNPFAYRPEGFAAGAGHGSTYTDTYGNYWHIGTITISQKHIFERRLGIFPVFFDEEGTMYADTRFGDYPRMVAQKRIGSLEEIFPGWMLLSYRKNVTVSSYVDTLPPVNMVDEDIRTYWSAAGGSDREWATLDLGATCTVHALQINFAEHNTQIFGRAEGLRHRYVVEYSEDGQNWKTAVDRSQNPRDNTHDYIQLPQALGCRHLRIRNLEVPGGHFALSGFRVFGLGNGRNPVAVQQIDAVRNADDRRSVQLQWARSDGATGYNIGFGTRENRLYHSYMVYGDTTVTINSLDAGQEYFFTVESFNENGVTAGSTVVNTP